MTAAVEFDAPKAVIAVARTLGLTPTKSGITIPVAQAAGVVRAIEQAKLADGCSAARRRHLERLVDEILSRVDVDAEPPVLYGQEPHGDNDMLPTGTSAVDVLETFKDVAAQPREATADEFARFLVTLARWQGERLSCSGKRIYRGGVELTRDAPPARPSVPAASVLDRVAVLADATTSAVDDGGVLWEPVAMPAIVSTAKRPVLYLEAGGRPTRVSSLDAAKAWAAKAIKAGVVEVLVLDESTGAGGRYRKADTIGAAA